MGSVQWATVTAWAFSILLTQEACAEVAKSEWWSAEGLKALSASVVRAAPDDLVANRMRANVLSGQDDAWAAGPRSAAEPREAAAHFDRAAAERRCMPWCSVGESKYASDAAVCRRWAEAM